MTLPIDRTAKTTLDNNLVNGTVSDAPTLKASDDVVYNTIDELYNFTTGLISAGTLSRLGIINVKDYNASGEGGTTTTGSITSGLKALTVASASTFAVGQGISIAGAGAAAAALVTTISAINGLVITLVDAASTTVVAAAVSHNESVAFQAANDALVAMGGGTLFIPEGTYMTNFICDSLVYIVGSGTKSTILKSVSGSNQDVIKGRNFATLTGTAKATPETRGVRYAGIKDVLIDGNKSNNTAGYGIRIWGCSWHWENVVVQNCYNDGIWTEFTTIDSPVGQADPSIQALESFYTNIKTINNGGNGWSYKGPHDGSIVNFTTFGNAGWGLYQYSGSLTGYLWNSWLNTLGSFYISTSFTGYKIQATGAYVGTGIEINSSAGNIELTDVYVAGHIVGMYLRGTNVRVSGNFLDNHNVANTAGDAIIIDGATNYRLDVTGSSNFNVFKPISAHGANKIDGNFLVGSKTLYSSDIRGMADYINAYAQDTSDYIFKLPTRTMYVAGWSPVFPQSNGTMITTTMAPGSPGSNTRGGVLQQTAPTNLVSAPTASDFNNLLTLLKQSNVLV